MAETAKNWFKSIHMYIPPKRANKCQQIVKNGNKWQKNENNCIISEITKYGEQMKTNYKNVKKMPTNGKKWQKIVKIANNCKISEITKYGEQMRKIDNKCK